MSWNKIYITHFSITYQLEQKLSYLLSELWGFFLSYVARLVVITHISFDTFSVFTKAAHDTWKSLENPFHTFL